MAVINPLLDTNKVRDNNTITNDNFTELNEKKVESDIDLLNPADQTNFQKVKGIVYLPKADYDNITTYDSEILYLTESGLFLGTILIADIGATPCP